MKIFVIISGSPYHKKYDIIHGYVTSEKEAVSICEAMVEHEDYWPYRFEEVSFYKDPR